jgi:hypothetical protein
VESSIVVGCADPDGEAKPAAPAIPVVAAASADAAAVPLAGRPVPAGSVREEDTPESEDVDIPVVFPELLRFRSHQTTPTITTMTMTQIIQSMAEPFYPRGKVAVA